MPEGLSDQDRAKIESAGQSASGCLSVVTFIFFGFAAIAGALAVFVAATFAGTVLNTLFLVVVAIGALSFLAGLAFRFIAKQ